MTRTNVDAFMAGLRPSLERQLDTEGKRERYGHSLFQMLGSSWSQPESCLQEEIPTQTSRSGHCMVDRFAIVDAASVTFCKSAELRSELTPAEHLGYVFSNFLFERFDRSVIFGVQSRCSFRVIATES